MTAKRRRSVSPQAAQRAAGSGWYQDFKPTRRGYLCCGRCGTESATVPAAGEPCLICKLKERAEARTAEGPF